ncbi:sirtuin 5 [Coprinopsis cinerea AmutBmut pab1-1]|nr:sirtuin 5 [Coprinopsis cinerea AmutBmut pab1-1]
MMRQLCLDATPNAAHRALASLVVPSVRAKVLPGLKDPDSPPLFITQNMDSLSPRTLDEFKDKISSGEMEKAKERLVEMHGNIFRQKCLQCKHVSTSTDSHLAPGRYPNDANSPATARLEGTNPSATVSKDDLPRCGGPSWNGSNRYGRCGGPLRPSVVWFGEIPEGLGDIARHLSWTDMLIVVGTSCLVHPAAGFLKTVKDRGGKVAIFNYDASPKDDLADFLFLGKCEEVLPIALGIEGEV